MNKQEKQAIKLICEYIEDVTNAIEETVDRGGGIAFMTTTFKDSFNLNGVDVCYRSRYSQFGSSQVLLIDGMVACKKMKNLCRRSLDKRGGNNLRVSIDRLIIETQTEETTL